MTLHDTLLENGIDVNWLFTHAKLNDKEGLIFFEVSKELDEDDVEFHGLTAQCLFVDGAKFIVSEDIEPDITINTNDKKMILNRIDGLEVVLEESDFKEFPYKLEEFSKIKIHHDQPQDTIEVAG